MIKLKKPLKKSDSHVTKEFSQVVKRIKLFMPPVHLLVIEVPYARCNIVRFHSSGNELPLIDNEVRVVIVEVIEMIVNDLPIELSDCVVIR